MKDSEKNNFDRRGGELMPRELMERAADPALVPDEALVAVLLKTGAHGLNVIELSRRLIEAFGFMKSLVSADWRALEERINTQSGPIAAAVENWLIENEFLVKSWSPIFLKQLLDTYYFKNGVEEVSLKKVWNNTCSYLYMPRIRDEQTFIQTFASGVASRDYFGYAEGVDGNEYVGFRFGERILLPALNDSMVVISKKKAEEIDERRKCPTCGQHPCVCTRGASAVQKACPTCGNEPCTCGSPSVCPNCGKSPCQCTGAAKKHYFGTIRLDPLDPVIQMNDVLENVIALFTAKPGISVTIKLDIEASSAQPFDKNTVVRPVLENAKSLGFAQSEFSAE